MQIGCETESHNITEEILFMTTLILSAWKVLTMFGWSGDNTLPSCWFCDEGIICQYIDGTTYGPVQSCPSFWEERDTCWRLFDTFWWKLDVNTSRVHICLVHRGTQSDRLKPQGRALYMFCKDADMTSGPSKEDLGKKVSEQVQAWREYYVRIEALPDFPMANVPGSDLLDPLPESWFVENGYTAGTRAGLQ
jgi:hypothetical protein